MSRRNAALTAGSIAFMLSFLGVLSFSVLSDFHPLGNIALFEGKTIFLLFVYIVTQVLMPAGGILVAIFAGWVVKRRFSSDELFGGAEPLIYKIWLFIVRFVAPVLLSLVLWDVATH